MLLCLNWVQVILLAIVFCALIFKLYLELTKGRVTSNTCLIGKTVLITGGNSGLGFQTALALAGRGARIIIADVEDSTRSKATIIEQTGNTNVVTKIFDLASLDSVRKLAKEINDEEDRLDVLINNAGIGSSSETTVDGLGTHMQINHLGPFLLTHLLIDLLKKSAPSRIIFVTSLLAFVNNLTLNNIDRVPHNMFTSYGNTKLCNIIASNIFARKLQGTGVTSNCVHPGLVSTPIFRTSASAVPKFLVDIFYNVFLKQLGKTPSEGAQCQIHCALSKKLTEQSGRFFVDCIPFVQPPSARNKAFTEKIWNKCEEMVNLKPEEKL